MASKLLDNIFNRLLSWSGLILLIHVDSFLVDSISDDFSLFLNINYYTNYNQLVSFILLVTRVSEFCGKALYILTKLRPL